MTGRKGASPKSNRGKSEKRKPPQKKNIQQRVKRMGRMDSEQQADFLERVSDGIVAFDTNMNYVYINPRGAEMLGRKPEELIGKNYWAEFPEAKDTPFAKAYVRALETQEALVIEDCYEPWDRWFENRIHPSQDGLTIFFTEITERKRAEKALRDSERGNLLYYEGTAQDITGRKRAEERIQNQLNRHRALSAGMDEYISKPVNLKSMLKVIQSFLAEDENPGE